LTAPLFLTGSIPQEDHNYISGRVIMQRITVLLLVLVVSIARAMQAQAPAPKPAPEVKKLHVAVGHWMAEGEQKPGPLGPGGKFTGEANVRMILGGFFLQNQQSGKVAGVETRLLEIDGYDPVNKNFSSEFYLDDGSRFSGVLTITGNTWTYAGKFIAAGKEYPYKATFVAAPDLTSWTYKDQLSPDGKTWTPLYELKFTKVQPPAKK
jgi:hypothetical protein